jgi:hypothetical protein
MSVSSYSRHRLRFKKSPASRLVHKLNSLPLEFLSIPLFLVQHGGYCGNTIQDLIGVQFCRGGGRFHDLNCDAVQEKKETIKREALRRRGLCLSLEGWRGKSDIHAGARRTSAVAAKIRHMETSPILRIVYAETEPTAEFKLLWKAHPKRPFAHRSEGWTHAET